MNNHETKQVTVEEVIEILKRMPPAAPMLIIDRVFGAMPVFGFSQADGAVVVEAYTKGDD